MLPDYDTTVFDLAWIADFKTIMKSCLPSCEDSNIYNALQINRLDFRQSIIGAQLPLPYYVFYPMKPEPLDDALDVVAFYQPLVVYGVFASDDPNALIAATSYDIWQYGQSVGHAFRRGLINYQGPAFQANIRKPIVDGSLDLPPNEVFIKNNTPCFAVGVYCWLRIGDAPNFTTVTTGSALATQVVGSTAGIAQGTQLFFTKAQALRSVDHVVDGVTVVLTSPVTSLTGEIVEWQP